MSRKSLVHVIDKHKWRDFPSLFVLVDVVEEFIQQMRHLSRSAQIIMRHGNRLHFGECDFCQSQISIELLVPAAKHVVHVFGHQKTLHGPMEEVNAAAEGLL
jgi:hypothetical protein